MQTQPKTDIIAEKIWQLFLVQKIYFIVILCKKVFSFYQVKSLTLLCGETFAALPPWLRVTPDSQLCQFIVTLDITFRYILTIDLLNVYRYFAQKHQNSLRLS